MANRCKLSVNVNKVALLRNSRGGNVPDLIQVAKDCVAFGADGITVHPRPDERHIRKSDVFALREALDVELNVEGYPSADFLALIAAVRPAQCTLVPDPPEALTSSAGWDTISANDFLTEIIEQLHSWGVRTSIFVNPVESLVIAAKSTGTDRIELYTGSYAVDYATDAAAAIAPYRAAAAQAQRLGLGLNAGHDLNRFNLKYLCDQLPNLIEVSIGHALIADALYLGLSATIAAYQRCLQ